MGELTISEDGNIIRGEEPETEEEKPDVNMLLYNQISGILPFQLQHIDDRRVYLYSVQGKLPLPELIQQHKVDYSLIRKIYGDILKVWEKGPEFFLEESHFVLDASMLYWDVRKKSLGICYFPGHTVSMEEQLERLGEYLLKKIDHRDKSCVAFLYGMYDQIEQGGFGRKEFAIYLRQFETPKTDSGGDKTWTMQRSSQGKQNRKDRVQFGLKNQSCRKGLPLWIELDRDSVTVGRGEENQVVLPVAQVSRRHAQIDQKQSRIYVTDLHSTNGVYLNGQKVDSNHPVLCREEDVISFADISYRLEKIPNLPDR